MKDKRLKAVPTEQINNECVVVTEWRFAPDAETGWHEHTMNYIVVPQTSGELTLETSEGQTKAKLESGGSYFKNKGIVHNVVNTSGHEFVFVEIELKEP